MYKIDLTRFFRREAPKLRKAIQKNIMDKQSYTGKPAPKNDDDYAIRKGRNHWLVNTGETMRKGIAYEYGKTSMKVFAKETEHSGKQRLNGKVRRYPTRFTYKNIFEEHTTEYDGVFGINKGDRLWDRMLFEASKQTVRFLQKELPNKINLKL